MSSPNNVEIQRRNQENAEARLAEIQRRDQENAKRFIEEEDSDEEDTTGNIFTIPGTNIQAPTRCFSAEYNKEINTATWYQNQEHILFIMKFTANTEGVIICTSVNELVASLTDENRVLYRCIGNSGVIVSTNLDRDGISATIDDIEPGEGFNLNMNNIDLNTAYIPFSYGCDEKGMPIIGYLTEHNIQEILRLVTHSWCPRIFNIIFVDTISFTISKCNTVLATESNNWVGTNHSQFGSTILRFIVEGMADEECDYNPTSFQPIESVTTNNEDNYRRIRARIYPAVTYTNEDDCQSSFQDDCQSSSQDDCQSSSQDACQSSSQDDYQRILQDACQSSSQDACQNIEYNNHELSDDIEQYEAQVDRLNENNDILLFYVDTIPNTIETITYLEDMEIKCARLLQFYEAAIMFIPPNITTEQDILSILYKIAIERAKNVVTYVQKFNPPNNRAEKQILFSVIVLNELITKIIETQFIEFKKRKEWELACDMAIAAENATKQYIGHYSSISTDELHLYIVNEVKMTKIAQNLREKVVEAKRSVVAWEKADAIAEENFQVWKNFTKDNLINRSPIEIIKSLKIALGLSLKIVSKIQYAILEETYTSSYNQKAWRKKGFYAQPWADVMIAAVNIIQLII